MARQFKDGWCGACNKFSGHRPEQCPKRPISMRLEVFDRGTPVPVPPEPCGDQETGRDCGVDPDGAFCEACVSGCGCGCKRCKVARRIASQEQRRLG